jgi:hypothetical protein
LHLVYESALPNPRMQPTGRICPGLRLGAASLEDAAERRFVRRGLESPQLMRMSLGGKHRDR